MKSAFSRSAAGCYRATADLRLEEASRDLEEFLDPEALSKNTAALTRLFLRPVAQD